MKKTQGYDYVGHKRGIQIFARRMDFDGVCVCVYMGYRSFEIHWIRRNNHPVTADVISRTPGDPHLCFFQLLQQVLCQHNNMLDAVAIRQSHFAFSKWEIYSRRKFKSQTSDTMGKLKRRWQEAEKNDGRGSQRRSGKNQHRESQKWDSGARKNNWIANSTFFALICVSRRSIRRLAKAGGVEPAGLMRDD